MYWHGKLALLLLSQKELSGHFIRKREQSFVFWRLIAVHRYGAKGMAISTFGYLVTRRNMLTHKALQKSL